MALAIRIGSSVFFVSSISTLIVASCEAQRAVCLGARYHWTPFYYLSPTCRKISKKLIESWL